MPSFLASKDNSKPTGQQQFIETADPGLVGIRDDLIIADGEKDITGFVWYLSLVAGISGFLYGWDTAVVGGALANIGDALGHNLDSVEQEWAVASLSAGAIVGTLIGGSFSDKIGRKGVLIIGDVLFLLGGILICASYSLAQFIVAPSMHRGRIVAVQSVMITGGQLCAYAVSAGLENIYGGWRILFALSLPFALGQGIAMHWLPETPRFAVLSGKIDGARKTLGRIYPKASEEQLDMKLKVIELATEVSVSLKRKHPSIMGRIYAVCTTPQYLRCTVCAAVVFLGQQLSGWNSFLYYSSTLFGAAGFTNTSAVGILVAGINCIFTVFSMFTMDRIGRRRMFLIGVPIMAFSLVIAAVAFHFMTMSTAGKLLDGQDYPKKWVGLMLGMMCFFIVGYAPSLGTIAYTTIELIPLEVRGIGSSIAVTFQWGGNLIISSTFLTMLNSLGAAGTYGLFAGFCFLTFVFIYFAYPESAGLTLEETGTLFNDGFGVKKADQIRHAKANKRDLEGAGSVDDK
ncbi:general substrate transporter [Leucosporidium creatinivorum]|uniref:General substrate transporter n=1 Tax=Leucosporidium creatinivorum TaxID=106004 RepID=A0A1Y2G4Y5_9BASI|nr:general substrate transporter [Leucosporidium creatinivorum]